MSSKQKVRRTEMLQPGRSERQRAEAWVHLIYKIESCKDGIRTRHAQLPNGMPSLQDSSFCIAFTQAYRSLTLASTWAVKFRSFGPRKGQTRATRRGYAALGSGTHAGTFTKSYAKKPSCLKQTGDVLKGEKDDQANQQNNKGDNQSLHCFCL